LALDLAALAVVLRIASGPLRSETANLLLLLLLFLLLLLLLLLKTPASKLPLVASPRVASPRVASPQLVSPLLAVLQYRTSGCRIQQHWSRCACRTHILARRLLPQRRYVPWSVPRSVPWSTCNSEFCLFLCWVFFGPCAEAVA
jgi:hypothetical protein